MRFDNSNLCKTVCLIAQSLSKKNNKNREEETESRPLRPPPLPSLGEVNFTDGDSVAVCTSRISYSAPVGLLQSCREISFERNGNGVLETAVTCDSHDPHCL